MIVNDDAGSLIRHGILEFIASKNWASALLLQKPVATANFTNGVRQGILATLRFPEPLSAPCASTSALSTA
ncbi:hypothetical protein TRE132_49640 [Pseudomonas chlororaphis subsp. aurantiaca]|nr:hypothetical protein TRE132_49640 [Pseudomonas chlororaphis subsp. aurantiaca]